MQFTIIGNPQNRRVILFCRTVTELGYDTPAIISYAGWLSGDIPSSLPKDCILKIDSPGEDDDVRRMLVARGLALDGTTDDSTTYPAREDFGAIRHMRAWYRGYCDWLNEAGQVIGTQYPVWVMNTPADIRLQFDKPNCQHWLKKNGIPTPFTLPPVVCYEDLLDKMRQHRLQKVFIKPAHASSASGVIAFRKMGAHVQAVTSTEMIRNTEDIRLYNSLTMRSYTNEREIAALVDRILQENAQVEEWLPKATLNHRFFDLRVLVIGGKARHTVIRTSRYPITNLHLGNKRGDMQDFISHIGGDKLEEVRQLAEKTAACFPDSLYMGIDILLTADLRNIFVLEVNAFGDLLPGLIDEGETCYEAQVRAMVQRREYDLEHAI